MSTMGRIPVMAAPTPRPLIPASEIGVSMTRDGPNSSTSPKSTLNAVPASATSSPIMKTRGSRRISSARASRMACPSVTSRIPGGAALWLEVLAGVDILRHLACIGIRSIERELLARLDLSLHTLLDQLKRLVIRHSLFDEPVRQYLQGVTLRLPKLLFLFRTIIGSLDIAHMMPHVAIRVTEQESWSFTAASTLDQATSGIVDDANILTIDAFSQNAKGLRPGSHVTGSRFGIVRVLVILVVLAHVDYGEFPQRGQIHHLVQNPLPQCAISEEADRYLVTTAPLARHGRAGSNARAPSDDGVRAQVAGILVGNMHGAAFAATIARLLAQQFSKHEINGRALRQAMTMPAMGAGDVIVAPQGRAGAHSYRFFTDIEVSQARHPGAGI